MFGRLIAVLVMAIAISACAPSEALNRDSAIPSARKPVPALRWASRPEGDAWTRAALTAIDTHGQALLDVEPRDIATYCPAYPEASTADRRAFWAGLISSLAKHESTWRPEAVGGDGRWFGLVQIAPATARGYGCGAKSGEALKNGSANVRCAVRIMAHTVPRDGVISAGGRGVAADWGPFHSTRKRTDIAAWTKTQPFCQPG
ncbi:MAG: transglycosylase SLT domain-containing protein [Qingshengfaniella sp.]